MEEKDLRLQKERTADDYVLKAKEQARSAVQRIHQDEQQYRKFLVFSQPFSELNTENCAFVFSQKPTVSQLKTYQHWKEEGRQVKKGEKSLDVIWQGKSTLKVFDVSQTEGPPLLSPEKSTFTYEQLKLICKSAFSYETEERNIKKENVTGFSDFYRKKIYIRSDLPAEEKIGALLYQIGWIHARTPDFKANEKSIRTMRAESIAYTLAQHFDIPFKGDFSYIPKWSQELSTENLIKNLESICKTARELTNSIQKNLQVLQKKELSKKDLENTEQYRKEYVKETLQKDSQKIMEKDYYFESLRDDNEIDLDREKSRQSLGFRDYDVYKSILSETAEKILAAEKLSEEYPEKDSVMNDLKKGDYLKYLSVYESLLGHIRLQHGSEVLSESPHFGIIQEAVTAIQQFHQETIQRLDTLEIHNIPQKIVDELFQLEFKIGIDDSMRQTEFVNNSPRMKSELGVSLGEAESKISAYKEFIRENKSAIKEPTPSMSAETALQKSLERRGKVDIPYMMGLSDLSETSLAEKLKGKIFMNIGGQGDSWVTAEQYLQGDLEHKLTKAKESYQIIPDSKVLSNIEALQQAISAKKRVIQIPEKVRLNQQLKKAKARANIVNAERREKLNKQDESINFKKRVI